ncbi:hypothetical protein [Haloquadratum walsbyi]|uniref:Uncharacterized protein n=1 Tax=Haloquadratum walsbyi J07HQW2 TaxID=1238425 RepID=U1MUY7_9EURY|nr:hypothetical protein [Haloquadratum walsbyi]ERG94209.1 MAG: hypothetical protein J07HQW2_00643 [Haloquadratum walsbyi J07HQW2]
MVTTLNITVTDEVADNARAVKQARELTWAQFIEVATDELERSDDGTVAEAVSLIEELEKLGPDQSQPSQSQNQEDEAESLIEEIERIGLEQLEPTQIKNDEAESSVKELEKLSKEEDEATTIAEILEKQEQPQPTQVDDDEIKSLREAIENDSTPE